MAAFCRSSLKYACSSTDKPICRVAWADLLELGHVALVIQTFVVLARLVYNL
jgi:hypothetical protein